MHPGVLYEPAVPSKSMGRAMPIKEEEMVVAVSLNVTRESLFNAKLAPALFVTRYRV